MFSLLLALNAALDATQIRCLEIAFDHVIASFSDAWTMNDVALESLAESVLIAGWIRLKLGSQLDGASDAEAVAKEVLDELAVAGPEEETAGLRSKRIVHRHLSMQ
jgi:hypothetical protein